MSSFPIPRRAMGCFVCLCMMLASVAIAGPSVRVEGEDLLVGMVEQGDRVPVRVVCGNTGDAPLEVAVLRVSCGTCTHARGLRPEARIAPGARHAFELLFDSTGKSGAFAYYLELETNDPKRPRIAVRFSGRVVRNLELETYAIRSRVPRSAVYERTIAIAREAGGVGFCRRKRTRSD